MIMPFLSVKDVDESIAYYVDKLGFRVDFNMAGPEGKAQMAGVSLGNSGFGLAYDPESAKGGEGVMFMVYVPDDMDIDAYYADVKARDAKIESDIKTEYWGDRVFSVRDIDGYYISLCKTVKQMTMDEIAEAARNQ
ncbi:MAG: VOC family protein [Chloroflexi bacterium]|nr:VOC family protein [Chloroflexota bacterium]